VKKPPPPPEIVVPPPPRLEAQPTPFIPPPEVQIATPPPPQPTITAVTPTPPPVAAVITPTPPPVVAPPAPPPAAAPVSALTVCSNSIAAMGEAGFPRDAARAGLEKGEAMIQFTVSASGEVKDAKVVSASHPIFGRASARLVSSEFKCKGQGHDVVLLVPFSYKLQ